MTRTNEAFSVFTQLFVEHPFTFLASAALLVVSGVLSCGETAIFSLSAPELNQIRVGKSFIDRALQRLHANLKNLLPVILFSNMAVNVLIYSLSASIASSLSGRHGLGAAAAFSLTSLLSVVFFGEVFPKQLAISSSLPAARATAVPIWFIYRALGKPLLALTVMATACERVIIPSAADSNVLREEELKLLVELSKNDGIISADEYELIDGIVELPAVRIRELMTPRVDLPLLVLPSSPAEALAAARKSRQFKIPVFDPGLGEPAGWLDVRDIYAGFSGAEPGGGGTLAAYLRKFRFFSEHDRADQALERIKGEEGDDLNAVVDERGQIAGFFTMRDIMDEVLGRFGENGAPPPVEVREENGLYIISGRLSVREWRELFGVSAAIPKSATVGGLVASLLGRMPKPGDRVCLENMEMTILSTWRNRVAEVELRLIQKDSGKEGKEGRQPCTPSCI
ncbi:MAG: CNNM domain-containing protein [Planctomycetes bacterium]|nr:CNNM domain-containing protein [Planctomycetota bacterium]